MRSEGAARHIKHVAKQSDKRFNVIWISKWSFPFDSLISVADISSHRYSTVCRLAKCCDVEFTVKRVSSKSTWHAFPLCKLKIILRIFMLPISFGIFVRCRRPAKKAIIWLIVQENGRRHYRYLIRIDCSDRINHNGGWWKHDEKMRWWRRTTMKGTFFAECLSLTYCVM